MEPNELLDEIRLKLHIPQAGDAVTSARPPSLGGGEAWHALRKAIRNLEESAGQVGMLPANYPMHLSVAMRVIHALLPWYTRPVQQHAANTVAVARAMESVLETMETRLPDARNPRADSPR
ncbi:MAG: hypothetical protein IT169_12785 [Bryobacterales bacterium]|nr:hypothetical protein [Bryobacterales bacterium]